ncbi:MAG: fatty acyl-AMP ligase [bacterium]|nr:fatty acyl-AMP ligase [bacterium]
MSCSYKKLRFIPVAVTVSPKGGMMSHGNLLSNEKMIQQGFGHSEDTIFVGWLPLFHDMGLIGNLLQPLYLGIHSVLMSPVAFLQKPYRWLHAISRYQVHHHNVWSILASCLRHACQDQHAHERSENREDGLSHHG